MAPLAEAVPGATAAPYLQPRQVLILISQLDALVSCSLHGCIFAYSNNVPFLALDSEGTAKVREFMEDRGLEQWLFRDLQDLTQKLPRLLNERPDYSESIARDTNLVYEHLKRIESIVNQDPANAALPSASEASVEAHMQRLQIASCERDFDLARLRNEHSLALAEKDAALARQGHTIAQLQHTISERDAALAAKDALLKDKDDLLAEKERRIASAEAMLAETEQQLREVQQQFQAATSTLGYRLLERTRAVINRLAPPGTLRRGVLSLLRRGLRVIL